MPYIDINAGIGFKSFLFPDNQPHITLVPCEGSQFIVKCSITNSIELINLLQVADAIDSIGKEKRLLSIPYLMGARFDRVMQKGDSFDLRVISNLINSMNFQTVKLRDVHSDVATALIKNSTNEDNSYLIPYYDKENSILICPDAGASKKVNNYFNWSSNIKDAVYCIKHRDLTTGEITLKVLEPEKCIGKNCVIIDDLCDGGGTFLAIAKQIKEKESHPKSLTLIVTHGIFSKGFKELEKYFDEIIVSDSYRKAYDSKIVKVVNYPI
jgi:ribose-phosphate pyrophosphokinase